MNSVSVSLFGLIFTSMSYLALLGDHNLNRTFSIYVFVIIYKQFLEQWQQYLSKTEKIIMFLGLEHSILILILVILIFQLFIY